MSLNAALDELAKQHPEAVFVRVEAEEHPAFSEAHQITAVPTFLLWRGGKLVERIEGAKAAELTKAVSKLGGAPVSSGPPKAANLQTRLEKLIHFAPVMLFMKGTPEEPQCGFSRQAVALLREHGVQFSSCDILAHPDVRAGLKEFSNWPTYPQLYANGKLLGGLDILKELIEEEELRASLPPEAFGSSRDDRLLSLINKAPVMLFMKGSPAAPQCGFSRTMVGLLLEQGIVFDSFDILGDPEVRQGLKELSSWPTYPQLYVNGKLLGGLDVVREMAEEDELLDLIPGPNKKKRMNA